MTNTVDIIPQLCFSLLFPSSIPSAPCKQYSPFLFVQIPQISAEPFLFLCLQHWKTKTSSTAANLCTLNQRVNKHTELHTSVWRNKDTHARTRTQATLSPFAPSGHVTKHSHPITSHLPLPVLLSPSLSHPVGIRVLSQSWEEKLGRRRGEKGRCWTNEKKNRGGKVFGAKNQSRLGSSHSLFLLTLTTLEAACRCWPAQTTESRDCGGLGKQRRSAGTHSYQRHI